MYTLTVEQKREFLENGYVKVPGVVPRYLVDVALKAINHSLGQGINEADLPKLRSQSYCPELKETDVITDLLNKTPALGLAESLIGPGKVKRVVGGQIGIRFPVMRDPIPSPRPHLDGMPSPNNGVAPGTLGNFTMLVGVMLNDLPVAGMGNFTVWPGTHRLFETYFREHGPEDLQHGMPKIEYPQPAPVTGQAGDVVLVHYQTAHGASPNGSPHPRYMVFFRLRHVGRESGWSREAMIDIWQEWPGIREIIDQPGASETAAAYP